MKRITLIKIHLYFSGVALIFMSMMALTGSLHLFTGDEKEEVESIKVIQLESKMNKEELTSFFAVELRKIDSSYEFDYIKGSDKSQISRPTTRTYYSISVNSNQANIKRHTPTLQKSFMELHKGHGARNSRPILGIFGLIVLVAVASGLWLGWSSPSFRKLTVLTSISGAIIYLSLFLL